jgi:hypothetical protein
MCGDLLFVLLAVSVIFLRFPKTKTRENTIGLC